LFGEFGPQVVMFELRLCGDPGTQVTAGAILNTSPGSVTDPTQELTIIMPSTRSV